MPGTEQTFRLNWAYFGIGERRPDAGPEHSIFVGDLAPDVTDYLLQETFRTQYLSLRGARVVTDPTTGGSKGYGFVKFGDENERNRAMSEMNGVYCSTRPMRISAATPKKTTGYQQQYAAVPKAPAYTAPVQAGMETDQWSTYYGYGQGYDAYGYGAAEDPSPYAYAGYPQYPQQVEGVQVMTGAVPMMEQREEIYDPLVALDVDKLNSAYLSVHGSAILGRPLWMNTSLSQA
ncbi:Polyadenylate-binding protein RBP47B' [Linum grandiflorum]